MLSDTARQRIKEQIEDIMKGSGLTPGEDEAEGYTENLSDQAEIRRIYEKANKGEIEYSIPENAESWEDGRRRDIEANFLFGEYIQHRMTARDPLSFEEYTRWVGVKALFRLMSRIQGGERMATALHPDLNITALRQFMTLDKHQERDPRLLMQTFFKEVDGGWEMVDRLLSKYTAIVEETWDKKRMKNERTPLPGEKDWYFEEERSLDAAVDAYLAGATINEAAALNGIGNRKLSRELTRLGIERVQRKGNK